jgi:large subunit ribosomal protein L21
MYAIVDIAGQQFKVEKDQKVYVHRLDAKEGTKVDFNNVLLIDDNGKVTVGSPVVENMVVSASVVGHVRGDKVKIFKKKRRKGYQKLSGHRQDFTEILIEGISAGKAKKAAKAKKEAETESAE